MSKRLQVMVDESELRAIQRSARHHRMTVAEWVRRAMRAARESERPTDPGIKLAAVRRAAGHSFPTADMEEMLAQIERGYLDDHGP